MAQIKAQPRDVRAEYAALDLGSNSFHMVVARLENGELRLLDRLKEPVRLGFGLDHDQCLDAASQARALACLARFGERIAHLPKGWVRCVGTKTLRSATNASAFIRQAERTLGHRIEVISGNEEARLIYQGVAHSLAANERPRLVADIGGGSTELILGSGMTSDFKESLSMGCVAVTRRFFADGRVTEKALRDALLFCRREIEPIRERLLRHQWQETVGASGTIRAASDVCAANQLTGNGITRAALDQLCARFVAHGRLTGTRLKALSEDREPVFLGGLVVLRALFEALALDTMIAAQGALREGLLLDMVGRDSAQDIRDQSVRALAARFHVDPLQADRIGETAAQLWQQAAPGWRLGDIDGERYLRWAAQLLEVGLDISHHQYHRHSAYICEHSDLPGFSIPEQQALAFLVQAQRKKIPLKAWKAQRPVLNRAWLKLAVLLRLAVILHRARSGRPATPVALRTRRKHITLQVPPGWLDTQPLLQADLNDETQYLKALDFSLDIVPAPA